jgi:hypothetical protein
VKFPNLEKLSCNFDHGYCGKVYFLTFSDKFELPQNLPNLKNLVIFTYSSDVDVLYDIIQSTKSCYIEKIKIGKYKII